MRFDLLASRAVILALALATTACRDDAITSPARLRPAARTVVPTTTTTYTDRSTFTTDATAASPSALTNIDFSVLADGSPITYDSYIQTQTWSGATFTAFRTYWGLYIYTFPHNKLHVDLPPHTVSVGSDLLTFYGPYAPPGTWTITLSTGATYTYAYGTGFFGIVSPDAISWIEFSYDTDYFLLDNFTFGVADPGSTPTGSDVTVTPVDPTTGTTPITVNFGDVTGGGSTTVSTSSAGAPPPSGFKLGSPPVYYEISTTATFSGTATVCINYDPTAFGNESKLKLLHGNANGSWTDVTTSLNTTTHVICGAVSSFSPFIVTEQNVAPVVTRVSVPSNPIAINTTFSATALFTDDNPLDAHGADFDWEGTTSAATSVIEPSGSNNGVAGASHSYSAAGVYTIQATVSDGVATGSRSSALDVPAYVVVFDPSAGFVTGGGWISSPVGACTLDTTCQSLAGKATFGFVAKYQKGQSAPSGSTEFQFSAGGISFASSSYDWLVIAGTRAQYKGVGSINGVGGYGFLLTAIDGDLASPVGPDRFRIKIWNIQSGDVVYDNQRGAAEDSDSSTALGGGSIQIKAR